MNITEEDMARIGHKDDWGVDCLYLHAAQQLIDEKLAALQASHEEILKALTVMLERCALVYTHPTLDPEFMKARKALANAEKLAPTKRGCETCDWKRLIRGRKQPSCCEPTNECSGVPDYTKYVAKIGTAKASEADQIANYEKY
jgi:hypothetical protein